MRIVRDIPELRAARSHLDAVAFVPTMGNLHEGHLSLVRLAGKRGYPVVASIFVNRLQFQPGEDFERYPRTLDRDLAMLRAEGVELVFAPDEAVLYPEPQRFTVQAGRLGEELEGRFRPGFFTGVATVVLKLFHCVTPTVAVFGKKDYQQWLIVRQMVTELNLPVVILAGDIVREADGLAMSSRNAYLTPEQRSEAPRLYRLLCEIAQGQRSCDSAIKELRTAGWQPDYIEVRAADLGTPQPGTHDFVVLGAARLGETRLIDNIQF